MNLAMDQARLAQSLGEVPVGAVVVRDGEIIGVGCNAPIANQDPTAHAEIVALRAAAQYLGNYRLDRCRLYVTLEPCLMCAGAILQSRVSTVIYATHEPKSGAAGSAIDVFSLNSVNHQTQVFSGLLKDEASELMRTFFKLRRDESREAAQAIREDALRTPDECFLGLPDYPWDGTYTNKLPSLAQLRLHYLDVGPANAPITLFCLHDFPVWSYAFRSMLDVWLAAGMRVVVPDLIGFGKSDKPKRWNRIASNFHSSYLAELAIDLNLDAFVLVGQGQGGEVADSVARALGGIVSGNVRLPRSMASASTLGIGHAYEVPYPDLGFKAALKLGGFHGCGIAEKAYQSDLAPSNWALFSSAEVEHECLSVATEGTWDQQNVFLARQVLQTIQEKKIRL